MVRLVPILVADGHTVYGSVASCIPDDQLSPAPPVTTKLLLLAPCTCKAANLSRGNKHVYFLSLALWSPSVAVTQALLENGQRESVILHH